MSLPFVGAVVGDGYTMSCRTYRNYPEAIILTPSWHMTQGTLQKSENMFPQDRDGCANYLKPLSTKHRHNIWHMDADGSSVVSYCHWKKSLPTKATDKRQCGPLKALHQCLILGAKFASLEKTACKRWAW